MTTTYLQIRRDAHAQDMDIFKGTFDREVMEVSVSTGPSLLAVDGRRIL